MKTLLALGAYLRTRWLTRRGQNRAAFLRKQQRRLNRWQRKDLPKVAFFADSKAPPITDKAMVMADFAAFNRAGITEEQGWQAFAGTRRLGALTIGASTGTSGNRGLFVVSEAERFQWLGVILAKALPDFWRRRWRVAVVLPLHTALYDSAGQSGALDLRFHDLNGDDWLAHLVQQDPQVILAPPKVLLWLVDGAPALRPLRLFSVAETLDPPDRLRIERHFGLTLGQIYMATEGLLGVSCAHGTLHLAEDVVHFEWEAVGELHTPIISGFTRREQILSRYRMNDLLRLSDQSCPCGSPLQAVAEVVGRRDDVFRFAGGVQVTPDVLRNAVLDADRGIADFRLVQETAERVVLTLQETASDAQLQAALGALRAVLRGRAKVVGERQVLGGIEARKRRRVECRVVGDV